MAPDVFFLDAADPARGRRLCLFHHPRGPLVRGGLVYLHPFAEEMNKSRRMAALQSRAFAQVGFAVLQIDLRGCGDSSGDFGDASWDDWLADAVLAWRWLRARIDGPLWLWGLRAGCLLASEAARRVDAPSRLLFWQPTSSGKQVLQQFLRLAVAGELLSGREEGGADVLKARLAAGEVVEVAGYRLHPSLARGLDQAELVPPAQVEALAWLEVTTRDELVLGSASQRAVDRWSASGCELLTRVVRGPAFWQTSEIEEAPSLVAASVAALVQESTVP